MSGIIKMLEIYEYILGLEKYRESRQFLANLYSEQEPLGKEFSDVLYDNLWDFYQEDKNEKQLDMWEITSNTESFRL